MDDARQLRRLTHKLYAHIYSNYEEMELNDMTDESLILDIDIINKEREKELAEKDAFYQEKLAEKENALIEKDNALVQKDNMIAEQQEEIIRLKQQLEELTNK